MGRFEDLINEYNGAGEDDKSPTIFDDLTSEYNQVLEGFNAKTGQMENQIGELSSKVTELQSRNYELLQNVSVGDEPITKTDPQEDSPVTINDLFQRR